MKFNYYFAALSGVFLEYFDLAIYSFTATEISKYFFPDGSKLSVITLAWVSFAIAYFLRPFGAVFFGHFADKYGRKNILIVSLLLMSVSTTAIGLLPSYQSIGILAPILLFFFRALQGFAVSTEYTGASTYLLEYTTKNRGLLSGFITSVSGVSVFMASLLLMCIAIQFPDSNNHWRFAFIIGGVATGILGIFSRLKLEETPEFKEYLKYQKQNKVPFLTLIKTMPLALLRVTIISSFVTTMIILITNYLPSYLQQQNITKQVSLEVMTILSITEAALAILCGYLAGKFGVKKIYTIGLILVCLFIIPIFIMFYTMQPMYQLVSIILLALFVAIFDGPMALYLVKQYPVNVRYTATSLSYSLAVIIGSMAPIMVSLLFDKLQATLILPIYLSMFAFILLMLVFIFKMFDVKIKL